MTSEDIPASKAPTSPLIAFGLPWLVFWALITTGDFHDHMRLGGYEWWEPLM